MRKTALTFLLGAVFSWPLFAGVPIENSLPDPGPNRIAKGFTTTNSPAKTAELFPVIFRFDPNASEEAEQNFHAAFAAARDGFKKNLTANFLLESLFRDHKLDAHALASDRFARVVSFSQNENKLFPLTRNLAEHWAVGESGDDLESAWAERLRPALQHYILPADSSFDEATLARALLISVTNQTETIDLESLSERGKKVAISDFYTLAKAKAEFRATFPEAENSVADFLCSFLKANCANDIESARRIFGSKNENPPIASVVPPAATAAKPESVSAPAIPAARPQVKSSKLPKSAVRADSAKNNLSIGIVAGIIVALSLFFIFRRVLRRKFRRTARRPVRTFAPESFGGSAEVVEVFPNDPEVQFWRERALDAELRLEKATVKTKTRLLPHLARLLMNKFVQRLASERTALLDMQEMATLKVEELEKCLEKINASRENQLVAYQRRIEQLEKELAAKNEENRELIRATIRSTETRLNLQDPALRRTTLN